MNMVVYTLEQRFVKWACDRLTVDADFGKKKIIFSDDAHFDLDGYVNKQNFRIWGTENPHTYIEKPTHPKRISVFGAGLDKASLRVVLGFITVHCEIRSLTRICRNYCRVCCGKEVLNIIKHLLCNCPAFSSLRLKTLGRGFFQGLNSVTSADIIIQLELVVKC